MSEDRAIARLSGAEIGIKSKGQTRPAALSSLSAALPPSRKKSLGQGLATPGGITQPPAERRYVA